MSLCAFESVHKRMSSTLKTHHVVLFLLVAKLSGAASDTDQDVSPRDTRPRSVGSGKLHRKQATDGPAFTVGYYWGDPGMMFGRYAWCITDNRSDANDLSSGLECSDHTYTNSSLRVLQPKRRLQCCLEHLCRLRADNVQRRR